MAADIEAAFMGRSGRSGGGGGGGGAGSAAWARGGGGGGGVGDDGEEDDADEDEDVGGGVDGDGADVDAFWSSAGALDAAISSLAAEGGLLPSPRVTGAGASTMTTVDGVRA
jgi:hypothetical protein